MRILHVAALPFPSPQGTQGLIAALLRADVQAGHDTHLLCYPLGQGVTQRGVTVHRSPEVGRAGGGDLHSGPSVRKIALDIALTRALAPLVERLAPCLVIAHHVEAAAGCALALRDRAWTFCMHTSLRDELPTYFSKYLRAPSRYAGALLDRGLIARASAVRTVSPLLVGVVRGARDVRTLPLPWPLPPAISDAERTAAREQLALPAHGRVVAYLGNLDPYQGVHVLARALDAMCKRDPALVWLLATASRRAAVTGLLAPHPDLARQTRVVSLHDEAVRRRVHAAASWVAVPRTVPGGVPIKLLDALARGAPVIASRSALAGYPLAGLCTAVDDSDDGAWRRALSRDPVRGEAGRAWVAEHCAPELYIAALDEIRARLACEAPASRPADARWVSSLPPQ